MWLLAGFGSSWGVGLRALVPCWLRARGCPQVLATWTSTTKQLASRKHASREGNRENRLARGSHNLSLPNHRRHPINFVIFYLLETSHQVYARLQRRGTAQRHDYQEAGITGSHVKVAYHTLESLFLSFSHTLYPTHQATQQAVPSKQQIQNPSIFCSHVTCSVIFDHPT